MKHALLPLLLTLSTALLSADPLGAKEETPLAAGNSPKIAWWPTLAQARVEAQRTGKPIFLLAATPHCNHISGMW